VKFAIVTLALIIITACSNKEPEHQSVALQDTPEKKNVVFILVDDLGYADIGAYNQTSFYKTPHIDKLAKSGVLFTNGYAASPVCSPTRAAIMTGKHPTRMQATEWFHINNYPHRVERFRPAVNKEFMADEELTMAEIFQQNGYKTAFLGKWHLGEDQKLEPQYQGFDVNIGGAAFGFPRGGYFSPYDNPNLADGPEGEYLTDRLADDASALIQEYAEEEAPFFVYLSFYTVHVPLEAPEALTDAYEQKKQAQVAGMDFAPEDQYFVSEETPRRVRIRQNHPTYAAMIEKMDDAVGRVLSAIDSAGVAEDTLVVFTSDNGGLSTSEGSPTSNLPLRGGKGWLYEGGIRVPMIVRAPGLYEPGQSTDLPAVSMDFLPTLAQLANVALPRIEGIDGINLDLTDVEQQERPIFWHYPHYSNQGGFPGAAVRKGSFKLIQNFENGSIKLFDLSVDEGEQFDIQSEYPEVATELKALLYEWYSDVDARFLRPLEGGTEIPWAPELSIR